MSSPKTRREAIVEALGSKYDFDLPERIWDLWYNAAAQAIADTIKR